MKKRHVLLSLVLVLLLSTIGFTPSDAKGVEYAISWGKEQWQDGKAVKRNNEWYIPVTALGQAYGIKAQTSNKGKVLDLSNTVQMNPMFRFQPKYYENEVITIMYHNIEQNPKDVTFISPQQLEDQITSLLANGFNVISMNDYMQYMLNGKPVPDNAVLLTFDDGYETFYSYVYPLFRKYNLTATNFVIASTIDNRAHVGRRKLTWEQMREMKQAGFSFFSHTYNSHAYAPINSRGVMKPMLTRYLYNNKTKQTESRDQYLTRVRGDLAMAERRLKEELQNSYSVLAFPYGAFNKDVLRICKELGINVTFTVKRGINNKNTRNGFRINGGNQNIKTQDLMEQLRNRGVKSKQRSSYQVTWNGVGVAFKQNPFQQAGRWYLPLRDLQQTFGVRYQVDNVKRTIQLFPGKYDTAHKIEPH
ncbi:polysaccharide deacetylase family protein [Paenibacillus sp. ACRRX]|uniref:polysaccharide deacetylase family protein n=1 Tax=Paenibacillus sp. ACRRX TaxID=2918206 RepID=UPI001EF57972|nr:polysaccharide deacetylase family protein [Paenibacillus sp. ACRRX]MCG7408843.1 polysaccharide deacetylase family protein [Paenibacillus sp. ACRRX]